MAFEVERKEHLAEAKNNFEFFTLNNKSYGGDSYSKTNLVSPIFFRNETELTKWIAEDVKNRAHLKFYSSSPIAIKAVVNVEITK